MSKFVILASARTGSTSLARVLGESGDVKMSIEPFHPDYSKWNPGERDFNKYITDTETMNKARDELFEKYTAIKVLDYQLSEEIYFSMLTRKDLKVLFLRRNNLPGQALSDLVAKQTSEWHKSDNKAAYDNLKPIQINEMKKIIKYVSNLNDTYLKFLQKNRKGDFLPLIYEELYSEDTERNIRTINHISEFLGITPPPMEAIEKYMKPSEAKINVKNLYMKVPNFAEIEKEFGPLS